MKDLTLARKVYEENKSNFQSTEQARSFIRIIRGHNGKYHFKHLADKSNVKPLNYDTTNSPRPFKEKIETSAKVLILDIETAPIRAYVWGIWNQNVSINQIQSDWFCLTWAAKWLFEDKVYSGKLTPREVKKQEDKRIIKGVWELLNEADIVIAHNCVEENTKVLKADLTWVPAGTLKEGDELLAFDENKGKIKKNTPRQLLKTKVTGNFIKEAECFKVILDNGEEIITTADHKWLKMAPRGRDYRWCETQNLRIGHRVEKFFTPWEQDRSYEAGWLSGFISGEGTLKQSGKCFSVDFCQRPGLTLNQALDYCKKLNITCAPLKQKKGGLGRGDTLYTYLHGGKFNTFEVLGKLRIERLINNINYENLGSLKSQSTNTHTIVSIEPIGLKNVAVLSTESKTFFAEGYAMHNCDKFDIPRLNSRFIIHDLHPPLPYQSIDTLKHIRRQFGFTSNKLDYVNKLLNLERKTDTGGFELWERCMLGEQSALDEMEGYNINDVRILEETYLHIRPWIKPHPNMGLFILDENQHRCPSCGSADLIESGKGYYTTVNIYAALRCNNCGATARKRVAEVNIKQRRFVLQSSPK